MIKQMTEEQSLRMAQIVQTLPVSTQIAIVNCLPNIPYGCYWGLVEKEAVKDKLDIITADTNIFVLPVKSGCVLQLSQGYLETVLMSKLPFLIDQKVLKEIEDMKEEAKKSLVNFILKAKKKGGYAGYLGIYSKNLVSNIRIKDTDYSAYRVDIQTALAIFAQYGVTVMLDGNRVDASVMANALQTNPIAVSKSLTMSPTKTGVFLQVVM